MHLRESLTTQNEIIDLIYAKVFFDYFMFILFFLYLYVLIMYAPRQLDIILTKTTMEKNEYFKQAFSSTANIFSLFLFRHSFRIRIHFHIMLLCFFRVEENETAHILY